MTNDVWFLQINQKILHTVLHIKKAPNYQRLNCYLVPRAEGESTKFV